MISTTIPHIRLQMGLPRLPCQTQSGVLDARHTATKIGAKHHLRSKDGARNAFEGAGSNLGMTGLANSPDTNPIENLWHVKLQRGNRKKIFWQLVSNAWKNPVDDEITTTLIESFPTRVAR